MENNAAKTI